MFQFKCQTPKVKSKKKVKNWKSKVNKSQKSKVKVKSQRSKV